MKCSYRAEGEGGKFATYYTEEIVHVASGHHETTRGVAM